MKTLTYILILGLVAMSPQVVSASLVSTGDTIKVADGPGAGSGGSFEIENVTTISGPDLFRTFCVELNEYLSFGTPYYVTLASDAIFGGVGVAAVGPPASAGSNGSLNAYDPLSPLTAWLYSNAVGGTLAGYTDSSASANDALQEVIWYIENETTAALSSLAATFYTAATTAAPTSIGNVRVMNLWTSSATAGTPDGKVQSLLVIVPEAATIAIWSVLGLIGVMGYAFRSARTRCCP